MGRGVFNQPIAASARQNPDGLLPYVEGDSAYTQPLNCSTLVLVLPRNGISPNSSFLRASLSYAQIAQTLKVSKPTLIAWSKKLQQEISNLKAIESESILEKFLANENQRLELVGEVLHKVRAEL